MSRFNGIRICECSYYNMMEHNGYRLVTGLLSNIRAFRDVNVNVDVWVNSGEVVTANKIDDGYYSINRRSVRPISKGKSSGTGLELRVTICGKSIPVHKLVALAYPELCGILKDDYEVHHIDCDHLNNQPSNLLVCSRRLHKAIHSKIREFAKDKGCELDDNDYRRAILHARMKVEVLNG